MAPTSNARYTSLLKDEGFSNLNQLKVRRLLGLGLAEMLGTAIFVATGCGNVVSHLSGSDASHMNTVLSFALGIIASIIIFGPISGPMLNPCLNLTALIMGHMSAIKFVWYTIFQVIGAYLGAAFIVVVTPNMPSGSTGFCTTHPNPEISASSAFAVETFVSFVLCLGLCHIFDKRVAEQGAFVFLKFAVIVVAIVLPLAKYEGGSVNPARSLGPALLSGDFKDQWLYWTAPFFGAVLACVIYRSFLDAPIFVDEQTEKKEEKETPTNV